MTSKDFQDDLPENFVQMVKDLCGNRGERWLENLPEIIRKLEAKWNLKIEDHFSNLSINYVANSVCEDNSPAVVKIGLPLDPPEILGEVNALRVFDGEGSVNILDYYDEERAILLERLTPGRHLKDVFAESDKNAVAVAIDVFKQLKRSASSHYSFTKLEGWVNKIKDARETSFPQDTVNKSLKFYSELRYKSDQEILLHGDLHHENILSTSENEFLAIDPKGVIGNIGYEIAVFLNNHWSWVNDSKKLSIAVKQFSNAFDISEIDLRKWAYIQQVLGAWWTFDTNGKNWKSDLESAGGWGV